LDAHIPHLNKSLNFSTYTFAVKKILSRLEQMLIIAAESVLAPYLAGTFRREQHNIE
jgi:hypothetical protein